MAHRSAKLPRGSPTPPAGRVYRSRDTSPPTAVVGEECKFGIPTSLSFRSWSGIDIDQTSIPIRSGWIALWASASYRCRIYMFATTSHLVIVAKLSQYMARQIPLSFRAWPGIYTYKSSSPYKYQTIRRKFYYLIFKTWDSIGLSAKVPASQAQWRYNIQ